MHTSLGGAVGHDPYAPCSEADLLGHGYDYWALGHIHKRFERRSEAALAVMPGILQGGTPGRPGVGRRRWSRSTAAGSGREIPLAAVAFETIDVDLAGGGEPRRAAELIGRRSSPRCSPTTRPPAADQRGGVSGPAKASPGAAGGGCLRGDRRGAGRGGSARVLPERVAPGVSPSWRR